MNYCGNCGAELAYGAICRCQLNVPPQNGFYGQPQRFNQNAQIIPGRKMIRVSGIIMTVLGGLMLLSFFAYTIDENNYNASALSIIFTLILGGMQLGFGIAGIVYMPKISPDIKKANSIIAFGIAVLAVLLLYLLVSVVAANESAIGEAMSNIILLSTLPILYIVGGSKMKNINKYR